MNSGGGVDTKPRMMLPYGHVKRITDAFLEGQARVFYPSAARETHYSKTSPTIDSWDLFLSVHQPNEDVTTRCNMSCTTCFPVSAKKKKSENICRLCFKHDQCCECFAHSCVVCGATTKRPVLPKFRRFFDTDDDFDNERVFDTLCDQHLTGCVRHLILVNTYHDDIGCHVCYLENLE